MSGSERKPGRLGRYVVGYRDRLLELGYTPLSVSSYSLVALGQLGLRHALASELLRQDASLFDIGQVLRHKDLSTTAIYAKVDFARLREVAQPWPGVGR
jgi:integrase